VNSTAPTIRSPRRTPPINRDECAVVSPRLATAPNHTQSGNSIRPSVPDTIAPDLASRLQWLGVALLAGLVLLVAALAYHQLARAKHYSALAQRQSHRRLLTSAPRGVIYDREHRILAGNRLTVAAAIDLGALRDELSAEERALRSASPGLLQASARARFAVVQRHLDQLNALTGRNDSLDAARLERHFARDRLHPFVLLDAVTEPQRAILESPLASAVPIQLLRSQRRWYPQASAASHALGRVRREQIHPPVSDDFAAPDYAEITGDSGLEKQYDTVLRGMPAEAIAQIDASGFPVSSLARQPAIPGKDIVTSLDLDLQLAASRAMDATPGFPRGAAIAISVKSGEILALVSKPDFDLNAVSPSLSRLTKEQIDADGGWLNRATQGLYPPGSSFKIFTLLAGLRGGTLQRDTVYRCDGFMPIGDRRFPCHHAAGHGDVTLANALACSCNIFAGRTGLAVGPNALAAEARRFHFDAPTGIDLPSETTRMFVPDPSWKKSARLGAWTDGDTANLAIGQGFLRVSPMQAACAVASLARRETLTVPTLLHQPGRRSSGDRPPEPLDISDANYAALIASMRAVVETGIGQNAQVPGVSIAGKTGTAQILRPEGMMNIAWFIAFAPVENPEIAVAVAMEGDTPNVEFSGAEHAAPIAREILGAYFDKTPATR